MDGSQYASFLQGEEENSEEQQSEEKEWSKMEKGEAGTAHGRCPTTVRAFVNRRLGCQTKNRSSSQQDSDIRCIP